MKLSIITNDNCLELISVLYEDVEYKIVVLIRRIDSVENFTFFYYGIQPPKDKIEEFEIELTRKLIDYMEVGS